jgi:hypothetical protein
MSFHPKHQLSTTTSLHPSKQHPNLSHRPSNTQQTPSNKRMATPNPHDYFAIRNVLALYCIALDTKNLSLLSQVLTSDITASYPFPGGEMQGLESVIATISKR